MAIQPLNDRVPIINADGTPTQYFIRMLQERGITVGEKITAEEAVALIEEWSASRDINVTSPITGGGPLSGDVTIGLATSGVTPGSYTNTNLTVDAFGRITLASNGSGGGGASSTIGAPVDALVATATPSVNFYIMKLIAVDQNFTINKIAFMTSSATATTTYRPFVYASNAAGVAGALLGSGVQVTGTTAGYNEAPLSAPVAVTKGSLIWVGVSVTTAAIANLWHTSGRAANAANGSNNTPAGTAPAITAITTYGGAYGLWGVA